MIVGRFQINEPDKLVATLQLEAAVGEWRQIRDALTAAGRPGLTHKLEAVITDLINLAEDKLYSSENCVS